MGELHGKYGDYELEARFRDEGEDSTDRTAQRRTPHWVMREAIGEYVEREVRREQFRQEVISRWDHYQVTGLHITGEEADAWLAKLEAGEDAKIPECHV